MIGLTDKSDTQELVIKQDDSTAVKYTVREETIDLDRLKRERDSLQNELDQTEPSDKELIELGKSIHPYYMRNLDNIRQRIVEIDGLLNT